MKSLLLTFAKTCISQRMPKFFYDYKSDMNLYFHNGTIIPLVEATEKIVCITTKTEAIRESDDTGDELLI